MWKKLYLFFACQLYRTGLILILMSFWSFILSLHLTLHHLYSYHSSSETVLMSSCLVSLCDFILKNCDFWFLKVPSTLNLWLRVFYRLDKDRFLFSQWFVASWCDLIVGDAGIQNPWTLVVLWKSLMKSSKSQTLFWREESLTIWKYYV